MSQPVLTRGHRS